MVSDARGSDAGGSGSDASGSVVTLRSASLPLASLSPAMLPPASLLYSAAAISSHWTPRAALYMLDLCFTQVRCKHGGTLRALYVD